MLPQSWPRRLAFMACLAIVFIGVFMSAISTRADEVTNTTDLANKIGQRGAVSVCEMLRDVAVQSLREQDIAATLGDIVLVCMPETDEAAGKVAADHIQRAIFAAVRPKLKMTVEIFSVPQIDQFLKTVWQ